MKRVLSGTIVAAAFAVGVSAQQTTPSPSQPMQDSKDAAKTVTVSGCLKAGEQPDSFVLSDIKWDKDKDKDRASAVGTSGTASAPIAAATSLKLNPSPSVKLTDHVGHQVEVSGTISDKGISAAPTAPADPASARPAKAEAALDVRNVKMVAATCSM